jgi:hypothetical protein
MGILGAHSWWHAHFKDDQCLLVHLSFLFAAVLNGLSSAHTASYCL